MFLMPIKNSPQEDESTKRRTSTITITRIRLRMLNTPILHFGRGEPSAIFQKETEQRSERSIPKVNPTQEAICRLTDSLVWGCARLSLAQVRVSPRFPLRETRRGRGLFLRGGGVLPRLRCMMESCKWRRLRTPRSGETVAP